MDSVKYLLNFLFKLSVVAFFAALVWWVVIIFNPDFRIRSLLSLPNTTASSTDEGGILPSPRAFKGLFGKNKITSPSGDDTTVYSPVFNGFANQPDQKFDYIQYRQNGVLMAQGKGGITPTSQNVATPEIPAGYADKSLFVRNLSIFEGGAVYSGLYFMGEARGTMFVNGKFPIIVADSATGRAISVSFAEATSDWVIPGWVKFQVKIGGAFPSKVPCLMIFEQARSPQNTTQMQPFRVMMPLVCSK